MCAESLVDAAVQAHEQGASGVGQEVHVKQLYTSL